MTQIFLLGASSVYGVGGANGGWGELLKQHVHRKMYAPGGEGEKYEVFNFAKSGATVRFVLDTFPEQLKHYARPHAETVAIVSVGGNNAKAVGTPDNYISTVESYIDEMAELVTYLRQHTDSLLLVNNGYVDESKTMPKINPFDGAKSYFSNQRRIEFRDALANFCREQNVQQVDAGATPEEWQAKYLYEDGLHPNDAGHRLLCNRVITALKL